MRLFSSLGRELQDLETRDPGRIGIYVCGPTVQSAPHLGHGRYAVVFDVIRRYLEWAGFEVTYVENITDVDDKIIAAANERGVTSDEVVAEVLPQFERTLARLGVRAPDIRPRATEHVSDMIAMIEALIDRGHAYPAASGDVYFRVRSYSGYGELSGRNINELRSGVRIEPDEQKEDPLDFALWKASKPGEPSWDSPWGPGRPGWHIECSAMSLRYLGDGFDIHGGGTDLVFPHHENEVAQAEASGRPFARYWLHNGMVNLDGEKMAKSTGKVVDLATTLTEYNPLSVRLLYLRTHYRKPIDFTHEALLDATASLERLWQFRRRFPGPPEADADPAVLDRFRERMEDDFDNAGALSVLFEAVRDGNTKLDSGEDANAIAAAYDEITQVFGIAEPDDGLDDLAAAIGQLAHEWNVTAAAPEESIELLIEKRAKARERRDWDTSDQLRDALAGIGIVLEDDADGTRWHRA